MGCRRDAGWRATSLLLIALGLIPGVVSGHDVAASRFDAPIPLTLLYAGAGGTVAVTALWLAVRDRSEASTGRTVATIDSRTVRWIRATAGATFFLGVVAAIVLGIAGRQVPAENVATVFTWPVWFRGVGLLAILLGSPWNALSPWRTLYRGLCELEGGRVAILGGYPSRLGTWPALVGFLLLLGVVENLTVVPRSPRLTAVVVSAYGFAMVGGAVLFGPTWFERADPLGVFYRLFGRLSGVATRRSGGGGIEVTVRPPWRGCRTPVAGHALVVFVVAAVYTLSFDGFTNTRWYQTLLFGVRDALATGPLTSVLLYGTGLLVFAGTFYATTFLGDVLGTTRQSESAFTADGGRHSNWRGAALAFAPTVLPIAAAYDVAHNYPYVVRSTTRLLALVTDPVRVGSIDPLGWLSLPAFWGSQVVLIVAGHVIAVVAAHHVAVGRYHSPSSARRGHLPLVVLMVSYTMLSLWIISQPVVSG